MAPDGLFRGGGNAASAKLYKDGEVRPADFDIQYDRGLQANVVSPNNSKGLSFASNIVRLEALPIRGKVWRLPREVPLPEGLVMNYRDAEHPLLNVAVQMKVSDLIEKLKQLQALMEYTGVTVR